MKDIDDPTMATNILGRSLLPPKESDPFGGEVPSTTKDFQAYKKYHEDFMRAAALAQGIQSDEGFIKFSANCEGRDEKGNFIRMPRQKPEHKGCSFVFSCQHVIQCDPHNPEDVFFVPFAGALEREGPGSGYFLCHTCYRLLEKRKLNVGRDVMGKCGVCVIEAISRMCTKDPGKYHDLRIIK